MTAKRQMKEAKANSRKFQGIEFGECVLWKRRPGGGALGKLAIFWEDGGYLGVKGTTGEIIIGAADGIYRTRSVRRKPEEDRWRADAIKTITGVPCRKSESDPKPDGEAARGQPLTEEEKELIKTRRKERVDLAAPHRFSIRISDVNQHGPTVGCAGCRTLLTGKTRQMHNPECRKRFEEILKGSDRVKASVKRENEFYERVVIADQAKRRKAGDVAAPVTAPATAAVAEPASPPPANQPAPGSGLSEQDRRRGIERAREEEEAEEEDVGLRRKARRGNDDHQDRDEDGYTVLNYLEGRILDVPKSEMKVNDDQVERHWSDLGILAVEGDLDADDAEAFFDDLTGEGLDSGDVAEARCDEMDFAKDIRVYEERPESECWQKTGKAPIDTRWIDTVKGPSIRSRWVARDFKKKGDSNREDLFAAMPPLEAMKALFWMAAPRMKGRFTRMRRRMKLMFIYVRKATRTRSATRIST